MLSHNVHPLWAVSPNGQATMVQRGQSLSATAIRGVIQAESADQAVSSINSLAFPVAVKDSKDEPLEIAIGGTIGDPWTGTDARTIQSLLRNNRGREIRVTINSPGGLAWDGLAMHNAFIAHDAPIHCVIDGICGSAATLPAVGATTVKIYENAQFFVHRASVLAYGNCDAMYEAMDWLKAIDDAIVRTYKAKTNRAYDKLYDLMKGDGKKDGTVMTAKQAVDEKFCDAVLSLKRNTAQASGVFQPTDNTQSPDADLARMMRERQRRTTIGVA